jgi:hypothetical protein
VNTLHAIVFKILHFSSSAVLPASVKFEIQDVLKRALQWYSERYCKANVTKTFTLKGLQTLHRSTNTLNDG